MTVSEAIKHLQRLKKKHGDIPLVREVSDGECGICTYEDRVSEKDFRLCVGNSELAKENNCSEIDVIPRLEQHIVTDLNTGKKMLGSYIFSGISWDDFVKAVHDTVEKTYGGKINDATDGWKIDNVNLFTESHKYGYPIGEMLIQYSNKGGYYDVDHDWQETGEVYKDIIILRGKNGHLMYSVGERFNNEQYRWYAGMVLDVLWQVKKKNDGYLRNINVEETIREINETIAGEES